MDLPYVYVYNIKLISVENGHNNFLNPVFKIDEIKKAIDEQKIDVLIIDFLDRASIKILRRSI